MNTKTVKNKEDNKKEDNRKEKELTKEQIAELKKKKKEMEDELDELKGSTTGGTLKAVAVFLMTLVICFGILLGLIKTNTGNFASDVLAPLIADVPVVRNILPADLQKKSASEIASAQAATEQAQATSEAAAQAQAASEAQVSSETQAASEAAAQAQADSEAAAQAQAASEAAAQAQADSEAALKDYVDTYSKMDPKTAAGVFDNMMTSQSDVVVKILTNLTASKRAAILSYMNVNNVSKLTVMMEK